MRGFDALSRAHFTKARDSGGPNHRYAELTRKAVDEVAGADGPSRRVRRPAGSTETCSVVRRLQARFSGIAVN